MIAYSPLQDPILLILLLLAAAKLFGYIAKRLGQPQMLGEIVTGIILGPMVLGVARVAPFLETMAELGIFFLMFIIGLRTDLKELLKVGWVSSFVALGGIALPMLFGYGIGMLFGFPPVTALFIGVALSITAVAVSGDLLAEFNLLTSTSGRTIIGAAVVDDILGMIALSLILALTAGAAGFSIFHTVVFTLIQVLLFFIVAFIAGYYILPRILNSQINSHDHLGNRKKIFTIIIMFTLLLAVTARLVGLHGVVGAFIAGLSIHHALGRGNLEEMIYDELSVVSSGLMTPLFFIWLGMLFNFSAIFSAPLFTFLLILAAIAGKIIGCGGTAYLMTKNLKRSLFIGIGMNGRGAVELIIAELGRRLGLFDNTVFSAIILMAFITTILTPPLMKALVKKTKTRLIILE